METLDFILLILHLCYNLGIVINQNGQSASLLDNRIGLLDESNSRAIQFIKIELYDSLKSSHQVLG